MIHRCAEFGVRVFGRPAASKAAIKRALKDSPDAVIWQEIATVGNGWSERAFSTAELLSEGFSTLVIVGPDPYRDRRWFGNVTPSRGTVKVT